MNERNVLGEIRSPGNSASSFQAPRLYMVESPRASVKIPRRQGRSSALLGRQAEASDQAVYGNTVRERAERERTLLRKAVWGISTMHVTRASGTTPQTSPSALSQASAFRAGNSKDAGTEKAARSSSRLPRAQAGPPRE